MLPLSVANICDFTYMCDPAPVGPDIHANRVGYSLIADTIEAALPQKTAPFVSLSMLSVARYKL